MYIEDDDDRACTWIACDCCGAVGEFGERETPPFFCGQCGALLFPKAVTSIDPPTDWREWLAEIAP